MRTFRDLAARLAERGDDPALIVHGRRIGGRAVVRDARRIARALLAAGVAPGDRVCVWLANGPEFVLVELAVALVGAVLVPIQTRYGATELAGILRQAAPVMLVYQKGFLQADLDGILGAVCPEAADGGPVAGRLAVAPSLRLLVSLDGSRHAGVAGWDGFLAGAEAVAEARLDAAAAAVGPDDPAICIFTSGTTGAPKGAMLSHRAILTTERSVGDAMGLRPGDRVLYGAPLPSVFGCCNALVASWTHDACLVLLATFDAADALATIEREGCTAIYGVPTMFLMLLDHPDFAPQRTRTLRAGIVGGAPCTPGLARAVIEDLGVRDLVSGYGMSETCAVITLTRVGDPPSVVVETVGRPLPGVELRIVDAAERDALVPAAVGEICVRGSNLMLGYLDAAPDGGADGGAGGGGLVRPFHDGWFRTGDLGTVGDDGNLRITGRVSDMILVGGFNVYPAEIERLLGGHPAVLQAHVVGAPDPRMGERPVAFVQFRAGQRATPAELAGFCAGRIAKYKVPAAFVVVEDFPMTPLGKVRKVELRKVAQESIA